MRMLMIKLLFAARTAASRCSLLKRLRPFGEPLFAAKKDTTSLSGEPLFAAKKAPPEPGSTCVVCVFRSGHVVCLLLVSYSAAPPMSSLCSASRRRSAGAVWRRVCSETGRRAGRCGRARRVGEVYVEYVLADVVCAVCAVYLRLFSVCDICRMCRMRIMCSICTFAGVAECHQGRTGRAIKKRMRGKF